MRTEIGNWTLKSLAQRETEDGDVECNVKGKVPNNSHDNQECWQIWFLNETER